LGYNDALLQVRQRWDYQARATTDCNANKGKRKKYRGEGKVDNVALARGRRLFVIVIVGLGVYGLLLLGLLGGGGALE
jgi:hypothetical protein